jgi:hypothetical protein
MNRSRLGYAILIAMIMLGSVPFDFASADGLYPAYDVQFLSNGFPTAMNEVGQVVGYETAGGLKTPWVYSPNSGLQSLPLPAGFTIGQPTDISDGGTIVGVIYEDVYAGGDAVKWEPDGGGYEVSFLGGLANYTQSVPTAINNVGDIVGYSISPNFLGSQAVLFAPGGVQLVGFHTTPVDINDQRQIVGQQARMDLDTGVIEDLGVPIGGSGYLWTTAAAINESGQVASTGFLATSTDDNRTAVRYTDGSGWQVLSGPGKYNSAAAINDGGDVLASVVLACLSSGAANYATSIYLEGQGLVCVQDLLHEDQRSWSIGGGAMVLNNARQVATVASNATTGQSGAVLLTPSGTLPPPTAPANLTAEPHTPTWQQPWNAITLTWEDTSLLDYRFSIERKGPGDADFVEIAQTRNLSYWDMDVGLGIRYDYRIRGLGLAGASDPSNVATATAPEEPVDVTPPVVSILSPADGAQVSGNVQIVVEASDNIALNFMDITYSPNMGQSQICTGYPNGAPNYTLTCNWNTRDLTPGIYTLSAYASDTLGNYATSSISVQVGSTSNPTLRSTDIAMSAKVKRGIVTVTGKVTVVDQDGSGVRSAMVSALWILPDGSTMARTAYTNRRGVASFSASAGFGTYVLNVENIVKAGYTFDAANSILSASITR